MYSNIKTRLLFFVIAVPKCQTFGFTYLLLLNTQQYYLTFFLIYSYIITQYHAVKQRTERRGNNASTYSTIYYFFCQLEKPELLWPNASKFKSGKSRICQNFIIKFSKWRWLIFTPFGAPGYTAYIYKASAWQFLCKEQNMNTQVFGYYTYLVRT